MTQPTFGASSYVHTHPPTYPHNRLSPVMYTTTHFPYTYPRSSDMDAQPGPVRAGRAGPARPGPGPAILRGRPGPPNPPTGPPGPKNFWCYEISDEGGNVVAALRDNLERST